MLSAAARAIHDLEPDGPRVRKVGDVRQQHLDLALERDPSGREILGFILVSAMPPKTSSDDIESKRQEFK